MMKKWVGAAVAASVIGGGAIAQQGAGMPSDCRARIVELCRDSMGGGMRDCVRRSMRQLSDDCRKAISERRAAAEPLPSGMREVAYGADERHKLDLIAPAGSARPPLIVFIHGGGWSIGDKRLSLGTKAAHFGKAYALASVNYRLVPDVTVEQQAADIASAIAWLRTNAAGSNYDADRIVLMGHSAGAHLAALLATDPAYAAAAKVPFASIRGVVLLDGAGYDVPVQIGSPRNVVADMYTAAFGTDPGRQARLSPTLNAAAPNARDWLILPVATRGDSNDQSQGLATALAKAGARARVVPVPGTNHRGLNQNLGNAGDFATGEVDKFLAGVR